MVGSLAACGEEKLCEIVNNPPGETTPSQIAAVIAPTKNFVDFETIITAAKTSVRDDLGAGLPTDKLSEALGRELSIVVADGVPQLASKRTVKAKGTSEYDIRTRAIDGVFNSFTLVSRCSAGELKIATDQIETQDESDLLAGLAIAADQFTVDSAEKKLYVLSNGIQTSGKIKMQEEGQFPTSEKQAIILAEALDDIGALPDLKGARVIWYGLGQVDGDFQTLGQKSSDSLSIFWQEVISRSNGILIPEDIYGKVGSGKPHKNAIIISKVDPPECNLVRTLYEKDGVQFTADTDDFVDIAKAKTAAKDVVDAFNEANCNEITVRGYAAAGVSKSKYESSKIKIDSRNESLTLDRAKAFANLLKQAGFSGSISSEGAGTCEEQQWQASGDIDKAVQKLCRRVEVSN